MNLETSFDGLQVDLNKAHNFVVVSNRIKYAYNPYCMRCSGLFRMREDKPFLWSHHCGAFHDERQVIQPEHVEVIDHQNGDCDPPTCPLCDRAVFVKVCSVCSYKEGA